MQLFYFGFLIQTNNKKRSEFLSLNDEKKIEREYTRINSSVSINYLSYFHPGADLKKYFLLFQY